MPAVAKTVARSRWYRAELEIDCRPVVLRTRVRGVFMVMTARVSAFVGCRAVGR